MDIKKLEKIFEKDDISILKQLKPDWYFSLNKKLSDNLFLVYEIKTNNNEKIHVVKNIKTNEFSFVLKGKDIRGIYNVKDIILYLEGKKSIVSFPFFD